MTEDEVLSGLKVDRKDLLDVRFKKGFCFIQLKDSKLMNKYKRQISTMELNKRKVLVYKVKDGNKEPEHKGKSKGRGNNLPMGTMGMKGRTGFRKSVGSKDDKME